MRNLDELQSHFQNYLLHQHPYIKESIISTSTAPAGMRLEIYRDAYYGRLLEALGQDYPVLCQLLGDDEFNQLGQQFIDANPSQYRSIRWFGKELASFMRQTHLYQEWLIEMAKFEWLLSEAFDAETCATMALERLGEVPSDQWPYLRFQLSPSLHYLTLSWNIVKLWKSIKEKNKFFTAQKS